MIRSDRRDARTVFFQDPAAHEWHELRWTGLPAEGQVPSFSDARVVELLRLARASGLRPRSDAELLPLLLKLLGGLIPVGQWPSQLSKKQKKEQAREVAQSDQAASDRPASPAGGGAPEEEDGQVVPLRWPDRAEQAAGAVDAKRRRRRQQAVPLRPAPPARLGERLRRTSMLLLPEDE